MVYPGAGRGLVAGRMITTPYLLGLKVPDRPPQSSAKVGPDCGGADYRIRTPTRPVAARRGSTVGAVRSIYC